MWNREACVQADQQDELAGYREQFALPESVIYLDGNSLGVLPKKAPQRAQEVINQEWGTGLVCSWNQADWFTMPDRLGDKLGPLIGAHPRETVIADTTSLNLFKVLAQALRAQNKIRHERRVILSERDNFPTDLYVIQGMIEFLQQGYELRLIDETLPLEKALTEEVAVVLLSHVNYRTGYLYDMAAVTQQVQQHGAMMIWDLCHSVGAVEIDLNAANADFAVGCTYKYLNGGPGSPAFVWVAKRHHDSFWQPLSGWWGHAKPFDMAVDYVPASGIRRFLCGTQPIVSMALLECGLEVATQVNMKALRAKSLALTDLFIQLVNERCSHHELTLITPTEHAVRGSHVSYRHPHGFAVMQALIAEGVIGDYREPEVLRFGVTPLYLGYADIWDAVDRLKSILDNRRWDVPEFHKRQAVT